MPNWLKRRLKKYIYFLTAVFLLPFLSEANNFCQILNHILIGLYVLVPDPGKGVCADPVNEGAILGKGGQEPQGGNKERQLSPDKGRVKT